MPRANMANEGAGGAVNLYIIEGSGRIIKRCFVSSQVPNGTAGYIIGGYNPVYADTPFWVFTTEAGGVASLQSREIGVVEYGPNDTGQANTWVNVVLQGRVRALCRTGTTRPISPGDRLEYVPAAPGRLVRSTSTSGSATVGHCAVAETALGTGTTAEHSGPVTVFLLSPRAVIGASTAPG